MAARRVQAVRFRSSSRRAAPAKREWARGAVFNQTVAAGATFSINMLSGFETDVGYEFRGTVLGVMQSWMSCTGSAAVNATIAIGVIPDTLTFAPGALTATLKEYPWTYYRRIMSMSTPTGPDTVQYGALSFDTNTRSARKLRQRGEAYQLVIDNIGAGSFTFCHWSNILLTS